MHPSLRVTAPLHRALSLGGLGGLAWLCRRLFQGEGDRESCRHLALLCFLGFKNDVLVGR